MKAKLKTFRYEVSNYVGWFDDSSDDGIFIDRCKTVDNTSRFGGPSVDRFGVKCKDRLSAADAIRHECEVFVETHDIISVSVSQYTVHRHNNGGHDTVIEAVTILYTDGR